MTAPTRRRRDAAQTRGLLLDAARERFARDGYAATTVRDIADDAGVNVALISRYFVSKEGLFEQCLTSTIDELRTAGDVPRDRIAESIALQAGGTHARRLGLLLRSSGDERADAIRLGVLRTSAERLAAAAGRRPGDPEADDLLLRAELVVATAIGLTLMRSSTPVEPLASAPAAALVPPLRDLIDALLTGSN